MTFSEVQTFDVDGKLTALSREECFTLGVEWGIAWQLALGPAAFSIQVHAGNVDRISALLNDRGRTFSVSTSPDWISFSVSGLD
jgi:hypothetical protein